jgi:hypothetical protein
MKNLTKRVKQASQITLAVIAVFIAASCAPPVEISDFDWNSANAGKDPAQNSGYTLSDFTPTASITDTTYSTTAGQTDTITAFAIDITFKPSADVLRGEITAAALNFITFHTFTKNATDDLTADTLSAAIPFTLEKRAGETISVKLTTTIDTAAAYSDLLLRVDGKKYTYGNGLRLDIDENGKIEDKYDDEYIIRTLAINGSGGGTRTYASSYNGPARIAKAGRSISSVFSSPFSIDDYATTAEVPATPSVNQFFFTGTGTTTNSNTLQVAQIGYISSTTSNAGKAYYKDIGDTLAKGIKLQKLNGTTWADVKTAEYDDAAPAGNPASWDTYIVIKGVTFDHLATYRVIWTGSANTETSGTYYGVKIRLYISDGNGRPLNQTEVIGDDITPVNPRLTNFFPSYYYNSFVKTTADSYDSEGKNVVLKVKLPSSPELYWKSVSLADFKKSFQVVYSLDGNYVWNGTSDLVYIDVSKIEYKAEGSAIVDGVEKGKNVLYITLDPSFVFDVNANAAYQNWLTNTRYPWEADNNAYQQYQSDLQQYNWDMQQYNWEKQQWDSSYLSDYNTWISDCTAYEAAGGEVGDGGSFDTDSDGTDDLFDPDFWPNPYPPVEPTNPSPVSPPNPNDGVGPQYYTSKGIDLYFRVNDSISVSDNAPTNEQVYFFGSTDNFAYDFFEFYSVF